jgi:acyl-CoA synthetase (AMP-forming)/AMP-acid ligase II
MRFVELPIAMENEMRARGIGAPTLSDRPQQQCGICAVPLFHVTGSHHIFISSFPAGRKLCLMYKWDPAEALRLIEVERATFWTGVPTMVQDLIEHPDFQRRDTSSLKSIGGGGAPTAPALVPKVNKRFKGTPSNGCKTADPPPFLLFCRRLFHPSRSFLTHALGITGRWSHRDKWGRLWELGTGLS